MSAESSEDCTNTVLKTNELYWIESFIAAPSACGGGGGGGCASVTCKFTVDNVVNSVKYNDSPLQISGGAVYKWWEEKAVSFQSCDDSCPGILEIKGKCNQAKII